MNFPLRKTQTLLQIFTLSVLTLSLLFPSLSFAQTDSTSIKFTDYVDLIEYTEDTKTNEIIYKYKTETVSQKTDNEWNENILLRQPDKEFYLEPTTGKTKVKIYSGDNYLKINKDWYQIEIATTTEEKFFDELEKTVPVETLFDKMVSFYEFYPAKAQTNTYSNSADAYLYGESLSWSTVHDASSASEADSVSSVNYLLAGKTGSTYKISRLFFMFDTSFIDTDEVESASFFLKSGTSVGITAGLVNTTQASELSITSADFDQCGTVDTPSEGADRVSIASSNTYYEFILNATGLTWIDNSGYTLLGVRGSFDLDDTEPSTYPYSVINMTEQTGTESDPYLEIVLVEGEPDPDPDPATSTPVYTLPCDMDNIDDISIITGCEEVYTDSTTTPSSTIYSYYRIPFLPIIIFVWVFLWVASRLILELIIRWRT